MSRETILSLLEQGSSQENIRALAQEDFDQVEAVLAERHTEKALRQTLQRVLDAQREMALTAQAGDADDQSFAAATAAFYSFLASLPPDVFAFVNLVFYRAGKNDLPAAWSRLFEGSLPRREDLPVIQSVRPTSYVMQVDNVFRHLPQLQEQNSVYAGHKGRREINTMVSLAVPRQFWLEGKNQMDAYDKAVLNGVNSLLENGTVNFTIPMLYHAMTGKTNPTVDEGLLRELQSRIERMRRTMITIDLSEELEARYLDIGLTDPRVEGYLLPMSLISARVNGKEVQVYHLLDTPPMLAYAKLKRQLATVPLSLLNAPLNNNATTIPLKNYIISRCEGMRNRNNSLKSNKILFSSIYAELGEQEAGKVRKKRIRDYTEIILQHMVDRGYLKGYRLVKTGRTIDAVEIELG